VSRPTIYVLSGMIASGKSTFARRLADGGAFVVSHDNLTEMLHQKYTYYQEHKSTYRKMEESLAREAIRAGLDVVVDRTHLTAESRIRWTDFARSLGGFFRARPHVAVVKFQRLTANEHASRRCDADSRGRPFSDWALVALHHEAQAERDPLDLASAAREGFDEYGAVDNRGNHYVVWTRR
jgi:predicted kinase